MSHVYKENGTKNEETTSSTVQIQINFWIYERYFLRAVYNFTPTVFDPFD